MGHCTSSGKRIADNAAVGGRADNRVDTEKRALASVGLDIAVLGCRETTQDPVEVLHLQPTMYKWVFVLPIVLHDEIDQNSPLAGLPESVASQRCWLLACRSQKCILVDNSTARNVFAAVPHFPYHPPSQDWIDPTGARRLGIDASQGLQVVSRRRPDCRWHWNRLWAIKAFSKFWLTRSNEMSIFGTTSSYSA